MKACHSNSYLTLGLASPPRLCRRNRSIRNKLGTSSARGFSAHKIVALSTNGLTVRYSTSFAPAVSRTECIDSCGQPKSTVLRPSFETRGPTTGKNLCQLLRKGAATLRTYWSSRKPYHCALHTPAKGRRLAQPRDARGTSSGMSTRSAVWRSF